MTGPAVAGKAIAEVRWFHDGSLRPVVLNYENRKWYLQQMNSDGLTKLLLEDAGDFTFNAKIQVRNLTVYNPEVFGQTSDGLPPEASGELLINWSVEFDLREWGIKDMVFTINRVVGHLDLSWDTEGETIPDKQIQISWPQEQQQRHEDDLKGAAFDMIDKWDVEFEADQIKTNAAIYPHTAEIDCKRRKIVLQFSHT